MLKSTAELEDVFPMYPDVHSNLVAGSHVYYSTADALRSIVNGIFVYEDENHARKALRAISFGFGGDSIEIPPLGNESVASSSELPLGFDTTIYSTMIVWMYNEAVVCLSSISTQQIPINELIRLAQLVQSRLEGKEE
jgi:hypothetical protein